MAFMTYIVSRVHQKIKKAGLLLKLLAVERPNFA